MRAKQQHNIEQGEDLAAVKCCCRFEGGGSVVVDS